MVHIHAYSYQSHIHRFTPLKLYIHIYLHPHYLTDVTLYPNNESLYRWRQQVRRDRLCVSPEELSWAGLAQTDKIQRKNGSVFLPCYMLTYLILFLPSALPCLCPQMHCSSNTRDDVVLSLSQPRRPAISFHGYIVRKGVKK